ncbi:MAG: putative FmdB family regulatory protein, partial [Gammaproteobacteria bacterium]
MPIYEYKCQDCGKVFEAIQKFSDPELTACRCEKEAPVKKIMSAAAFHLKGSGWYVTDFRDKDKGKDKGKDEGQDKEKGKSAE